MIRVIRHSNYTTIFDTATGFLWRSGLGHVFDAEEAMFVLSRRPDVAAGIVEQLGPTSIGRAEQPEVGEAPELLDIAVTLCCTRHCPYCYMDAGAQVDMPLEKFEELMGEAEGVGVFQVALGGGEPTIHPEFVELLAAAREHQIVPNYTTNGDNLTDEVLAATAKYCGAAAISYHDGRATLERGRPLTEVIPTNIHFILSDETVDEAIWLLQNPEAWAAYKAIVFLRYKGIGRAKGRGLTAAGARKFLAAVKEAAGELEGRIGFDACLSPLLFGGPFKEFTFGGCDAGRFSMFIGVDGRAKPCSFLHGAWPSAFEQGIMGCWRSAAFNKFRKQQERVNCSGCPHRERCHVCPVLGDLCSVRLEE